MGVCGCVGMCVGVWVCGCVGVCGWVVETHSNVVLLHLASVAQGNPTDRGAAGSVAVA